MNSISRLLVWRYLINTSKKHSLSAMVFICFFSMLIGTFSLTLVVSIMGGFEKCTHQKLQSIHSPIIMESPGNRLDRERIELVLSTEFIDIIKAYAPFTYQQALASNKQRNQYYPVTIKGIDPEREPLVSNIKETVLLPKKDNEFSTLLNNNQIVIGKKLAHSLHLSLGDNLIIMCPDIEDQSASHIDLHEKTVTIGGIIETGIEEFDHMLIYCSLELMHDMFHDSGIAKIGVNPYNRIPEKELIATLSNRFGMHVYSWKELYPALISALKLEKYAMFFILLLITLVASMNLISLMFMFIHNKKRDIALLSIYGMSKRDIHSIFIMIGLSISSIASSLGIILACALGYCIDHFKLITLPDSYYVSHLPVTFDAYCIITIFISSIAVSLCASYFSSKQILQIRPLVALLVK